MDGQRNAPWRVTAILDALVVLVSVVLTWPLVVGTGYPVARDAVFTPHLPFRPESLGVSSGSPRAAPLDAVVAALSVVADGAWLAKALIVVPLLIIGWAAHRAVAGLGTPARMLAANLAVWNPFVIERLGLGQWALLYGYAAVMGLAYAAARSRPAGLSPRTAAPWLLLGVMTPSSAVIAGVSAVALADRGKAGRVAVLAVLAQVPWVLPALVGAAARTSDPAGVAAFAARAERSGSALWSLVGLGGIWDSLSTPGSRGGVLGHLTSALVLVVLVIVVRFQWVPRRMLILGVGSLLAAAVTTVGAGVAVMEWATAHLPGAGLFRDAQKWLIPFVVLVVLCSAAALEVLVRWLRDRAPVLVLAGASLGVVAPFLLLPDGHVVVHRVLRPVAYPVDYREVAARVDGTEAITVSLPWQLYRRFEWATDYATYDPISRWLNVPVVTADALQVGGSVVHGEDERAAQVGAAIAAGDWQVIRDLDVRFLVVHRDPSAQDRLPEANISEGAVRYEGEHLILIELADSQTAAHASPWTATGWMVLAADLTILVILAGVAIRKPRQAPHGSATVR